MPPPDGTSSLLPVARTLNLRQMCYRIFYWSFYFVYFLLLLVDVVKQMYVAVIIIFTLFDFNVIANTPDNPKMVRDSLLLGIVFNLVDTLICWIFLGFVAKSPRSVSCVTVLKNRIRLARFWTLVSLLVLYLLGTALVLRYFFSSASQYQVLVMEIVTEALDVFTKVALVGVLNYIQVRNVARSRFKYTLLKGTLGAIWFSQMCTLIFVMGTLYGVVVSQEGSFKETVMNLFILPFVHYKNN